MWLEEFVWFWLPVVCGASVWALWNIVTLKAEVRILRERLQQLEDGATVGRSNEQKVA
jgi:hypothetical protein